MNFSDYLKNTFEIDEPIYLEDISFEDYSRQKIFKELQQLIEAGELKRFSRGIYYLFEKTKWGDSFPNIYDIITRRFITDGYEIYGYISGFSLWNQSGLSTQVPPFLEVSSNNESTRVRDIYIGSQRIKARKSRTKINKENVNALQLLDLMSIITASNLDKHEKWALKQFIKESGATKEKVMENVKYFPSKANLNLIESGAIYELA